MKIRTFFKITAIVLLGLEACKQQETALEPEQKAPVQENKIINLLNPQRNDILYQNDSIRISWASSITTFDSVFFQVGEWIEKKYDFALLEHKIKLKNAKTGKKSVRVTFYADSLKETYIVPINVFASEAPIQLKYKILNKFPHDNEAYTQGLFFHDGYLYESTGRRRASSLRKVNIETGDVLKKYDLKDEYFGEGITLYNNKIFMLTYTSQKGFIFNLNNLELLREFHLQTMEGWGLTTYNNQLVLSDGSSKIYFHSPETFVVLNELDVCNHKRPIIQLNELEYTPQGLYANVYTTHQIVRIDIETGAVTGELNLEQLFPDNTPQDIDHVLNGIAWDSQTNSFYITGKLWPILYQIQILD